MIIYILCYNTEILNHCKKIYTYPWAKLILLKNQNASFENVFWEQLDTLYEEWKNEDYVGVLSHSAFKKINLKKLNDNFVKGVYTTKYVHFYGSNTPAESKDINHPYGYQIMNDCLTKFKLKGKICYFNYFMCHPEWMKKFINWYHEILPVLLCHPLIWTDAKYKGKLTKLQLVQLWGHPYYPHLPFILERLNGCFFQTNCDSITIDKLSK